VSAPFELWVYEHGAPKRVTSARHLHTLKLMWRPHRDAAVTMDGELLEHKASTEPMALRAITAAALALRLQGAVTRAAVALARAA
jgi:hypothetical protein